MNFTYQPQPVRILFGAGRMQELTKEIQGMSLEKPGLIATGEYTSLLDHLREDFGTENISDFRVTDAAITPAQAIQKMQSAEVIIAIGDEATLHLAKAVAPHKNVPFILIPTTFSGIEMTISQQQKKGNNLLTTIIYDTHLLLNMPEPIIANSAMQAMAHLIEALYARAINPITYQAGLQGIQAMRIGIEKYIDEKNLQNAGDTLFFGAYLGGQVWAEAGIALQHRLVTLLHTEFGIEESAAHAVLLPYVLAFNSVGIKRVIEDVKSVLQTETPSLKLRELVEGMGGPITLAQIGMQEKQVGIAAEQLARLDFYNPIDVTKESAEALLKSAFVGDL